MAKRKNTANTKSPLSYISYIALAACAFVKLFLLREFGNDEAVGFYTSTLFVTLILCAVFGRAHFESISTAVKFRLTRGQVKNASSILKTGTISALILSALVTVVMFMLRNLFLSKIMKIKEYISVTFLIMLISFMLFMILATLLGFYDGYDFRTPIDTSRFIFAVSDLLFGLLFIFLTKSSGEVNSKLFHNSDVLSAHCALGASVGLICAVFVTLLWNLALLVSFMARIRLKLLDDLSRGYESTLQQIRALFMIAGYPYLRDLLIYGSFVIVMIYYFVKYSGEGLAYLSFGGYYIPGFLAIILPYGFTVATGLRSESLIRTVMRRDDAYHGGMQALMAIKQFLCTALPFVLVCDCILSRLYADLDYSFGRGGLLMLPVHGLFLFNILLSLLLCGFSDEWKSICAHLIAIVFQFLFCILLTSKGTKGISTILLCNLLYLLIAVILNGFLLYRHMVYKKNLSGNIIMPLVCVFAAVLSSILCMLLCGVLGGAITTVIALIVSFIIHSIALVVTGSIRENETEEYPQKIMLRIVGSFLGFYR